MKIVVGILEYGFLVFLCLTRWTCLSGEEVISTSWSNMRRVSDNIPLMKQHFVLTRTIRQTDLTALLDWLQCCIHKEAHIFVKNHDMLKCWSVNELSGFFFLSPVMLCIARLQIAVSWAIYFMWNVRPLCLSRLWVQFLSVLTVQRKKGKYVYYSLCPPEDIDILGNVASLFDVLTPKLECNVL